MNRTTRAVIAGIIAVALMIVVGSWAYNYFLGYREVNTSDFLKLCGIELASPIESEEGEGGANTVSTALAADGDVTEIEVDGVKYLIDAEKISKIKKITVNVYQLRADFTEMVAYKGINDRTGKSAHISCYFGRSNGDFMSLRVFEALGVTINHTNPNAGAGWSSYVMPLIIFAVGIIIVIMVTRSMNGANRSAMDFGKSTAKPNTNVKVRFNDVAGAEEEKEELKEIVEFLKNPKKFSELGARIPKGVLLVGRPGTGKTLFAKAIAGEAGVPFFSISGSDFVEMFVGVGASRVRDLFNTAKKSMPCIVFIDEIDAVGRQRGTGLGGGHDEREQTLNQLLVQMDGFEANDGIIVMAATNRSDVLDPALLRPGRFDRQIYVHLPDVRGREAILKVHARNKPMAADVNFRNIARLTSGFSGADLENLLNEAAILAAREGKKLITNKDVYEGINKVMMGPQKKSRLVTERDKRITAYHEAGHAILAKKLDYCDPVQEVTIIPRGMAGGYTLMRPANDDNYRTKNQYLDNICMGLGGRIAEELIIQDISGGAYGDIKQITDEARTMVTRLGMSESLSTVSYDGEGEVFLGRDMGTHMNYSEDTAKLIDEEIKRIIDEQHRRGTEILSANIPVLHNMARLLIERETIYSEEVDMLLEGKEVAEILAYMDEVEKNGGHKNELEKEAETLKAAEEKKD